MGLFVGIGNYIGNRRIIGKKDPQNLLYNLITEQGTSILTEYGDLILREIEYNIVSEDNEYLVTELGQFIIKENDSIYPEGLIARYACYDKTNEDEDRDVLKDLSGNGHDIQLYNFAFSRGSGYGLWSFDFKNSSMGSIGVSKGVARNVTYDSCEYKPYKIDNGTNIGVGVYISCNALVDTTFICEGILPDNNVYIVPYNRTLEQQGIQKIKLNNGINKLNFELKNTEYTHITFVSDKGYDDTFVKFKIIPNYKGALVSDGSNDYGLCENFPILDRDRGYTILAIRKWISFKRTGIFISNALNWQASNNLGAFIFEQFSESVKSFMNYSINNKITYSDNPFVHTTSNNYNFTNNIKKGTIVGQNKLHIFGDKGISQYGNIALYALEIYDRDLTDEEIAKVKARMIAEYEAKTGEKYVET